MTSPKKILSYATLVVIFLYFFFRGLAALKPLLAPLAVAIVLALLVLPLNRKMERSFFSRATASFINTIIIFLLSLGFLALFSVQVRNLVNDWPKIKQAMQPKVESVQNFLVEHTPLTKEEVQNAAPQGPVEWISAAGNPGRRALGLFNSMLGFLANYLLTFVYIFFLLNHRRHFKDFLLKLFDTERRGKVRKVISESATVTQQYLLGRLILTAFLAGFYIIGLGITGINNFILVSVFVAIVSIIPYVGNMIGFAFAMTFGYLTSGEMSVLIGISVTFFIGEFIESYILTPYVLGDKVDLHPFLIILSVIVGNLLWGIVGMLLAIPLLAIFNVVLMHVPPLKPLSFLLSKEKKKK